MPGPGSSPGQALVPGIHVLNTDKLKDVDGRDKPGHDAEARARMQAWQLAFKKLSQKRSYVKRGASAWRGRTR